MARPNRGAPAGAGRMSRIAYAACLAVFLAGAGGLVAHYTEGPKPIPPSIAAPSSAGGPFGGGAPGGSTPTTSTTTPGTAAATDAPTLDAELLVANDLGGYYTSLPAMSASGLAASGCLAGLGRTPGAAHRATQYLRGPFDQSLPDINEQLASFTTASAASTTYVGLSRQLADCTTTDVRLAAGTATATLSPVTVPTLGDEATVLQGPFRFGALDGRLTVAAVRASTSVIVVVYADRTPPSLAILGSAVSTLRAAVGKATP